MLKGFFNCCVILISSYCRSDDDNLQACARIVECVALYEVIDNGYDGKNGKYDEQDGNVPDKLKEQVYAWSINLKMLKLNEGAYFFVLVVAIRKLFLLLQSQLPVCCLEA